ncbi:MAG: serine/threonine protein kinase, partial [Myxococcales bacterium]|nr:serine/threonine protein kinase [Myxococcales bacterium]
MSEPKSPEGGADFQTTETSSAIRPLAPPDVIDGRYRVLGRLGAGAMGVVLRAEDVFLERPVAIKIVAPSKDPAVGQRFVKEAQALAQVRHENVVQVYAFGPFQHSAYLAMELVMGESLESIIDAHTRQGTTVALPRAVALLRAVAHGLDAVHARQLVHRDVKPANIIVEKGTDRPVLIDFGLARRRSKSDPRISITGGTPSYMAPEQAQDPDGTRVTPRA